MSNSYREAGGTPSDVDQPRKGSIRAARERMEPGSDGVQGDRQRMGLPTRPDQNRGEPSTLGPPIPESYDSEPSPQWPLPSDRAQPKGPPPQRPPRPQYVPSVLDPTRTDSPSEAPVQTHSPTQQTFHENELLTPTYSSSNLSRPLTFESQGSTVSSLGTIPDFPVPSIGALPRRSPNLGPPPSARRGPSSYYSQASYVSPIVEENENRRSRSSYASSAAMPGGNADFYMEDGLGSFSDEDITESSPSSEGRHSRGADYNESSGLVRQASLGRKTKPKLTTVKSKDNVPTVTSAQLPAKTYDPRMGVVGQAAVAAGAAGGAVAAGLNSKQSNKSNALSSGTGLLDPSSSSESESSSKRSRGLAALTQNRNRSRSPLAPVDPRVDQILGGLEKGGALDSKTADALKGTPIRQNSLANRVGSRRPPRLNVDAVREAESRGSLTSLPDLIRRATRLASNLDRGRTASRLGFDFYDTGSEKHRSPSDNARRSVGSLSDILASFPPPGLATPTGEKSSRPVSRWPSGLANSQTLSPTEPTVQKRQRRKRRCCGMPTWAFVLVLLGLVLLVAAAIIVPVALIVIPNENKERDPNSAATAAITRCQKELPCGNSGATVLGDDGSCRCLCTNGFTGETCTNPGDSGCITADVTGISNATLGSSIPRLLEGAQSNFSVPLNASILLSLFSSTNISCSTENALVTFRGLSARSLPSDEQTLAEDIPVADVDPSAIVSAPTSTITATALLPRLAQDQQDPTEVVPTPTLSLPSPTSQSALTSNGILFAANPTGSSLLPSTLLYQSGTPTVGGSKPGSTSSASNPNSLDSIEQRLYDFARITVLFVFQQTKVLDTAVDAQTKLTGWLDANAVGGGIRNENSTTVEAVAIGGGFVVDFSRLSIKSGNGTTVGGKGISG